MAPPKKPKLTLDQWGMPPVVHVDVLAHLTGVSVKRLNQLITDNRLPIEVKAGNGVWHTSLALREIFGYYRRQADKAKPKEEKDIAAQTDIEDLRAKRLKNAKMARELLPGHVYVQVWGEILTTFKNRWMSFGPKMGPRAFQAKDKVEAAEILNKEVENIFAGLNDPRMMEDIASKVRDDEFETDGAKDTREASGNLVTEDAESVPEADSGIPSSASEG